MASMRKQIPSPLTWLTLPLAAVQVSAEVIWRGDLETVTLSIGGEQWARPPESDRVRVVALPVRAGKYGLRIDGSNADLSVRIESAAVKRRELKLLLTGAERLNQIVCLFAVFLSAVHRKDSFDIGQIGEKSKFFNNPIDHSSEVGFLVFAQKACEVADTIVPALNLFRESFVVETRSAAVPKFKDGKGADQVAVDGAGGDFREVMQIANLGALTCRADFLGHRLVVA